MARKVLTTAVVCGNILSLSARLAQLVEHMLDVHGVTGSSPVPRTRKTSEPQRIMFIGTQCDLWGRPDGTGHEKISRGNFPRLIFSLIPSLSVRQHFIGYADLIHDSRRICYPAKAGTKVVQPVPPRSAASFSSERVNK